MAKMVLTIRFLAFEAFCGSPSEAEYWMPPRMIEITAISPNMADSKLIKGLTYVAIRSQLDLEQLWDAARAGTGAKATPAISKQANRRLLLVVIFLTLCVMDIFYNYIAKA
jgi:hypothetical protein